jgi:hypothetical protein
VAQAAELLLDDAEEAEDAAGAGAEEVEAEDVEEDDDEPEPDAEDEPDLAAGELLDDEPRLSLR